MCKLYHRESEADRQIREIMGRVMKHATAVLGDIEDKGDQSETGSEGRMSVATREDEVKSTVSEKETSQSVRAESIPEERRESEVGWSFLSYHCLH